MKKKEFKEFFKPYAKNVDQANNSAFWFLCDKLIIEIIKNNLPKKLNKQQIILDAGGGTGRWICSLSDLFTCNFILYDLSEDMLEQAKLNIAKKKINHRVKLVQGNLENMSKIPNNSVDYIVSIYNPISFVDNVNKATKELHRILKKNGRIIIMGQGFYNAIFSKINNYKPSAKELKDLAENYRVKWAKYVPTLKVFSKERLEKYLISAGFKIIKTYGVPIFAQPQAEDFDRYNKKISNISKSLEDKNFFKTAFETEMKYNSNPTVINRGMNIFTVAKK